MLSLRQATHGARLCLLSHLAAAPWHFLERTVGVSVCEEVDAVLDLPPHAPSEGETAEVDREDDHEEDGAEGALDNSCSVECRGEVSDGSSNG